nr:hypothetical protein [Sulfitobacter pontiacus]
MALRLSGRGTRLKRRETRETIMAIWLKRHGVSMAKDGSARRLVKWMIAHAMEGEVEEVEKWSPVVPNGLVAAMLSLIK